MLIKQNKASLIESAEDVQRFMNWEEDTSTQGSKWLSAENLSDDEQTIIASLRRFPDGININELTVQLTSPTAASHRSFEMEFKGLVKCLPGGMYRVVGREISLSGSKVCPDSYREFGCYRIFSKRCNSSGGYKNRE